MKLPDCRMRARKFAMIHSMNQFWAPGGGRSVRCRTIAGQCDTAQTGAALPVILEPKDRNAGRLRPHPSDARRLWRTQSISTEST